MSQCAICLRTRATRTVLLRDANSQRITVGVCSGCAEDENTLYDYGRATDSNDDSNELAYARERW